MIWCHLVRDGFVEMCTLLCCNQNEGHYELGTADLRSLSGGVQHVNYITSPEWSNISMPQSARKSSFTKPWMCSEEAKW